MKSNPDKCHVFLSTSAKVTMNGQDLNTINSGIEKRLSITIDNLSLQSRVNNLCKKVSSKISALAQVW